MHGNIAIGWKCMTILILKKHACSYIDAQNLVHM